MIALPRPGRVRFRAIGIAVALALGGCAAEQAAPAGGGAPFISDACLQGYDLSRCTVRDLVLLEAARNYLTPAPPPVIVGPAQ